MGTGSSSSRDESRAHVARKHSVSKSNDNIGVTTDRISDIPQRSGSFQAMVRVGDAVTAYLRTGKGEPVIVLRRADAPDVLWAHVLAEVSSRFRAILPERAPEGAAFAPWFRSFLDGLGLGAVRVVADAHFGICCTQSGVHDPDWISMLVIVADRMPLDELERAINTIRMQTETEARVSDSPTTLMAADLATPQATAAAIVQQLNPPTR